MPRPLEGSIHFGRLKLSHSKPDSESILMGLHKMPQPFCSTFNSWPVCGGNPLGALPGESGAQRGLPALTPHLTVGDHIQPDRLLKRDGLLRHAVF